MKWFIKGISLILCITMLCSVVSASEENSLQQKIDRAAEGLSSFSEVPGELLKNQEMFPAGNSFCDWAAIALALAGAEEYYDSYLEALQIQTEEAYAKNGCLDKNKATEYHRFIITILALGGDPSSFGKKPDGTAIDLIADGTYNYVGKSPGAQGLNGWIWALIALDASGEEVPSDGKYQREDFVNKILEAQEPDGGFGLISGSSDVDITAMALQALAPWKDENPGAIEDALAYLAQNMTDTCGYISYGAENAESTAQVILALTALGIDPEKDERFMRNGNTLLTEIDRFVQADGTYGHLLADAGGDLLATAQTMHALISVQRLRDGQEWVFCFNDYKGPNQEEAGNVIYIIIGIGVLACAAGGAVIAGKRKKYGKANRSDSK